VDDRRSDRFHREHRSIHRWVWRWRPRPWASCIVAAATVGGGLLGHGLSTNDEGEKSPQAASAPSIGPNRTVTPSLRILVRTSSVWDLTHPQETRRRGWCLPRHVVTVAVDNAGSRTLTLQHVDLVVPPRVGVRGDVETVVPLKRSSKFVGEGAYTGTPLPHTLLPGRHAEFNYAAAGSATIRRSQFVRVRTNLTNPVERPIPYEFWTPFRCGRPLDS
jgi:hypothetical protein